MKKILLYSGGMDSWLIRKIWKPDVCVYVNMHTQYSKDEINRLDEDVKVVDFDLSKFELPNKIIPLRNLYLCMQICNMFPEDDLEICLGATAGDRVLDKSYKFAEKTSDLLSYLWQEQHWTKGRKIKINIDFKKMTKTMLLQCFIDKGGDIDDVWSKSFSCYDPIDNKPCWNCKPCFRKFVSFALNGKKFDEDIVHKSISYIKKNILPDIKNGTYNRADEEKEILKVLEIYDKEKEDKIYAVDFDGTLTLKSDPPAVVLDNNMVQRLKNLKKDDRNKILLYTSRVGYFLKEAIDKCCEVGLQFDDIISGKPYADVYIDDKNIRPEEFNEKI